MTMAAIGIGAGIGAALKMGVAVIQKKSFGDVLKDGLIGGVTGGATGGLGSFLMPAAAVLPNALSSGGGAVANAATSVAADAGTSAATNALPAIAETAATSAPSVASNIAPTFGQSALNGLGKSGTANLFDAPSSLSSTLNLPSVAMPNVDFGQSALEGLGKGAYGANGPSLGADLASSSSSATPSAPWEMKDYTQAINAGSQVLNTGMNLAAPGPQTATNYTQNSYAPQRASDDSLLNSLLNLSRS